MTTELEEANWHRLTLCVPAYNEADAVGQTLAALRAQLPEAEIICVDDGSTDATGSRAAAVEGVRVIRHRRNIGYGAAVKTAMREATRDAVAWVDADGQHRPADLGRVAAPVLAGRADCVIGSRARGSAVQAGRLPGKWVLNLIAQIAAREKIPDLNSGLRCFRREVILRYLHLLPDGFSASTTSTLLMLKRGYDVRYVDIVTAQRVGTSTVRMFRDGWRTVQLIVRILILFEAFGFFAVLALLQVVPGVIYGTAMALATGRGFPVLAATVIVSGVLTFFMGLLCDQIVALRKERIEDRPGDLRDGP